MASVTAGPPLPSIRVAPVMAVPHSRCWAKAEWEDSESNNPKTSAWRGARMEDLHSPGSGFGWRLRRTERPEIAAGSGLREDLGAMAAFPRSSYPLSSAVVALLFSQGVGF